MLSMYSLNCMKLPNRFCMQFVNEILEEHSNQLELCAMFCFVQILHWISELIIEVPLIDNFMNSSTCSNAYIL